MNIRTLLANSLAAALGTDRINHLTPRIGRKDADPADVIKQLEVKLDARDVALKQLIEKANTEAATAGGLSTKTADALNAMVAKSTEIQDTINALTLEVTNLKTARVNDPVRQKSTGELLVESDDFKNLAAKGRGTAMINLKAVATIGSGAAGSSTGAAGAAIWSDRLPGIITPSIRTFTIRDLIAPGRTASNNIEYIQETGYQNFAAPVGEGLTKPQSDITFTRKNNNVATIAHWVRATKQVLADAPALESYINVRMMYGLKFEEETQLLTGDGTGVNLLGLIPQATAFDTTKTKTGDTKIDTLRRAILQVRIALYKASGIVVNPVDWADIELTKDSQNRYIWVNVTQGGIPQLWQLPVVDSDAMPVGTFMVGAFNIAAQLFDREDANVMVSNEDQDNFIKNLVTIRCEERLALIVFRPQAFVYGTFPEVGSAPEA